MKMPIKIGLVGKIALAVILGVIFGAVSPDWGIRAVNTISGVIDQFIKFMVPMIILGLVIPAIAETGRGAGRMLVETVSVAYLSTIIFGFIMFLVSASLFPNMVETGIVSELTEGGKSFAPYVKLAIPPLCDVMSALIFSFMLGLGMVFVDSRVLKNGFDEFRAVVVKTISVVLVPMLPVYIFGIFADMTATGKALPVLNVFAKVIGIFSLMIFLTLIVQYSIAAIFSKRNPFKSLKCMFPAFMTALGTSSSAATIPVTINCTVKNGVKREIADFTIPLCATVHLAGSTLKIVACAVAVMIMSGRGSEVTIPLFLHFICLCGVIMVAAPGVPGGAVMSSLGLLQSVLGFGETQTALVITVYLVTDSIGTAGNVTGDGAIALIMDAIHSRDSQV